MAYEDYNPAARLHTVLTEANAQRDNGAVAAQIWGQILDIDWPAEKSLMLRSGADLQDLAAEVKSAVIGLTGTVNTDLALRYFNEVEATLDQWIGIAQLNMQQFMAPLQGTGLYSVEVCADALKRHASEPALDADAIGTLLEKVHELQREVGEADDLDGATKAWITHRLVDIERALLAYKVTGTRTRTSDRRVAWRDASASRDACTIGSQPHRPRPRSAPVAHSNDTSGCLYIRPDIRSSSRRFRGCR